MAVQERLPGAAGVRKMCCETFLELCVYKRAVGLIDHLCLYLLNSNEKTKL